jgi:hypothetical protein
MKVSENFSLVEFVPKSIWDKYGTFSTRFIDKQLPIMAQGVRDFYKTGVTINDWSWGGGYSESGFRDPNTSTGAPLSSHKRGMAIDIKVKGVESSQVYKDVVGQWDIYFKALGVTSIEEGTVGWTHLSCEWTNINELLIIPFYKKKEEK